LSDYPTQNRTNLDVQSTRNWLESYNTATEETGTITSAKICHYGYAGYSHSLYLKYLVEHPEWIENQVTWNIYSTGNNWNVEGGQTGGTFTTIPVNTTEQYYCSNVNVNFNTTYSFSLTATEGNFDGQTRTDTNKPYLEITYTPGKEATTTIPIIQGTEGTIIEQLNLLNEIVSYNFNKLIFLILITLLVLYFKHF